MESSKKVKAKCCLFMFYLCCQQFVVETKGAGINKSDVAKYLIQRKSGYQVDVFGVSFKQTCNKGSCNPSDMTTFCNKLSADSMNSPPENFPYSCACQYHSQTFLPEKRKCVADDEVVTTLQGAFC